MTTAAEIITEAYRESNITPIGQAITTAQQTEALPLLNRYIASLFGTVLGEFQADWTVPPARTSPVPAQFPELPQDEDLPPEVYPYPPINRRLLGANATATTVYLYPAPSMGSRISYVNVGASANMVISANGRTIEGTASVTIDPSAVETREWFYRADLGDWVRRTTLTLTDEQPFQLEYDDLLIIGLAMRLNPRYGRDMSPLTAVHYDTLLKRMKREYAQTESTWKGVSPDDRSHQAYQADTYFPDERNLYR